VEAVFAAAFAGLLSHAQRRLSTPVRLVRRRVTGVSGTIELANGTTLAISRETLSGGAEQALRALAAGIVCLALALVLLRVT
jgi:hypothetical protein